jgi:dephospho-CoA kinase
VAFLLGLTGNIACGKSTIGQLLADRYAADYVDADRLVHGLYAADTPETGAIAARFGTDLLRADGTIDRRRLGDAVLADPAALQDLERILDPGARKAIEARIASSRATVVVLDAVRLIEGGLYRRCDAVWVVLCERKVQLERLESSRNFNADQALVRVDAQPPVEARLGFATAVIHNDASPDELVAAVDAAWNRTVRPHLRSAEC